VAWEAGLEEEAAVQLKSNERAKSKSVSCFTGLPSRAVSSLEHIC